MGLLDDVLGSAGGRPAGSGGGGPSGITLALMALLAYRTMQGKGRLADMLGTNKNAAPAGTAPGTVAPGGMGGAGQGGGLGGLLGGLLGGGAAGSILSGGLGNLINQLQQAGHGDVANSWVGTGPNKPVSPTQLQDALGNDTVNSLAEQAGMPREDLLSQLSKALPGVVDKLTPDGRLPTEHEASKWV
jgi:uncharacterized protein YidB (DUF937 family)